MTDMIPAIPRGMPNFSGLKFVHLKHPDAGKVEALGMGSGAMHLRSLIRDLLRSLLRSLLTRVLRSPARALLRSLPRSRREYFSGVL